MHFSALPRGFGSRLALHHFWPSRIIQAEEEKSGPKEVIKIYQFVRLSGRSGTVMIRESETRRVKFGQRECFNAYLAQMIPYGFILDDFEEGKWSEARMIERRPAAQGEPDLTCRRRRINWQL